MRAQLQCHCRDSHGEMMPMGTQAYTAQHTGTSQTQPVKCVMRRCHKHKFLFTHIQAHVRKENGVGGGKQSLENDGKDLHNMKPLDILEQPSFPGLYVVLHG